MGRAFDGVLVIDLGQIYNGPYCTMLLAQLGADVIKVEPFNGEPVRWRVVGGQETQAFVLLNAGKRSLRLDLKTTEGHDLLLRLVEKADVLVENFAPGTMDRLGLTYEVLVERNPRIIVASGKGYGSTGPYKDLRAMDLTVQAMTGVLSCTGYTDQPPVKAGAALADFAAGIHLMAGISAALYQRTVTGQGQYVEVSMYDAVIPTLTSNIAGYLDSHGSLPERTGNRHGGLAICPYNVYPSKDGWVAIMCISDRHWVKLTDLMRRSDLANDPELQTNPDRAIQMDRIDNIISEWTSTMVTNDLVDLLYLENIPAAPIVSLANLLIDPQVQAHEMLRKVQQPGRGEMLTFGNPIRLSKSDPVPLSPAPELGQDSAAVLQERLGLNQSDVEELTRKGVI